MERPTGQPRVRGLSVTFDEGAKKGPDSKSTVSPPNLAIIPSR